jgi:hypothetical protein
MTHPIQCTCGNLKGILSQRINRVVCYCKDCQAFARFLKRDREILDEAGGTDIIQTTPKNVTFSEGIENLACVRITPNGLLRWYTTCCNTPIGNTPPDFKTSFVGLVHNCLGSNQVSFDEAFGPIQMRVYTKYAKGEPKPKSSGVLTSMWRSIGSILRARLDGSYKLTPFFRSASGVPIVSPMVLSSQELAAIMDDG